MNNFFNGDGISLGSFKSIKLYLSYSWFLIAAFIIYSFTPTVQAIIPRYNLWQAVGVAALYALFLALSILIHEIAHAACARYFKWPVRKIVLNLFGGHTQFNPVNAKNSQLALVALSGPFANLILAGIAWLAFPYSTNITVALLVQSIMLVNLFVGIFNLLPAFPLDGGRALEALLTQVTSKPQLALKVTAWLGRVLCLALVIWIFVLPLMQGQEIQAFSALISVMLISYLYSASSQALKSTQAQPAASSLGLSQVAEPAVVVPEDFNCAQLKELALHVKHIGLFDGEKVDTKVELTVLDAVPEAQLKTTKASAVSVPFDPSGILLDSMSKEEILKNIALSSAKEFFVVDSAMKITGFISYDQILKKVKDKSMDGM